MNLYDNTLYNEDIENVINLELPWDKLQGKKVLVSGATGLIGSFLVDVLLSKGIECFVYALGRNIEKAKKRFIKWNNDEHFAFIPHDINVPLNQYDLGNVDYVIHMASNTHPVQYSTDPIGTILTNTLGVRNMLEFALEHGTTRFVFTSSNEIYGENRGDVEKFKEEYCGYINCNTLRAGYSESKRCGEALCQAYKSQKGLEVVVPRLTRSYGPTMLINDTKAVSQFIKNGVAGEDIVLKSAGTQKYSYIYVADAVSGLLYVILKGENGEAYNIADENSDITLNKLAGIIASIEGKRVIFEKPDKIEAAGYSTATKAILDSSKLRKLGWRAKYDIKVGIERTLSILKCIES